MFPICILRSEEGRLSGLTEFLSRFKKEPILTPEAMSGLVEALLTPEQKKVFLENKQLDFAYSFEDKARFRVNVYFQRGIWRPLSV